ncbi:hypothetical protein [Vibrio methylphosphonaticus]|uniref:hypothetical protein n=1 Tax=Vibrio methylphosphonaticus TaxID=2946866 RepID=UPI002029DEAA|nr:hypothetical protein [Vibrio methylphosphonaticus]MCL9774437.1 hypothetical protein [Vibrio methylphosphonaticus]
MENKANWITHKVTSECDATFMQDNGKNWLICTPEALSKCLSTPPCELSVKAFNATSLDVSSLWF